MTNGLLLQVPLNAIRKMLEGIPDLRLVYSHHPCTLKFFLMYPDLLSRFGHCVLELWLSREHGSGQEAEGAVSITAARPPALADPGDPLLPILKSSSSVLLILLVGDK